MEEPQNRHGAFPRLDEELLERFRAVGKLRQVESGEILFQEGDDSYDFFIVESGMVAIVRGYGCDDTVVAVHGRHRFLGELNLLTGSPPYLTAVVRDPGEVIEVPLARLREMLSTDEDLSNLMLRAFMQRRSILIEAGAGVKVIGSRYSEDANRLREFLARNRMPFQWMDLEQDEEADRVLRVIGVTPCETPVVIGSGQTLRNPSNAELGAMLGLGARGPAPAMCDVVIIGGGPAGLASAVYGGSEGLATIMIEREAPGGQAGTSSRIENYLGFPGGISGGNLAHRALLQAKRFGTEILVTRSVAEIRPGGATNEIVLDGDERISARAVVLATGVAWRTLDAQGATELIGRGVYYGAAGTEALETRGNDIFLVGGGNSAGQAAVFFSNYARTVTLLVRRQTLEATMSHYLIAQLRAKANVAVEAGVTVERAIGKEHLEAIVTRNADGEDQTRPAAALFTFIGADAQTGWLPAEIERDPRGYLRTGRSLTTWGEKRHPFALETNIPGIFAAGDVRSDSVKRVASGVGEGSMVIAYVHQYFEALARDAV
jgi:thioredoxin reductase (NADPH)